MTLDQIEVGAVVQVTGLEASPQTQERLRSIGFGRGRILTMLQKQAHRPLLVGFFGTDSRVGIGADLAQSIKVKPRV